MITRNDLIGIIVLLAGLTAGYFASRGAARLHNRVLSEFPDSSVIYFSTYYDHSKEQFRDVVNQGPDALREAAHRRSLLVQSRDSVITPHEVYDELIALAEREVDLLRSEDYFRQFFMHYYRWLDTGNAQSSVQYKLALGQFKATLDYLKEKYREDPCFTSRERKEFRTAIRITEQTDRTMRWARVVVVVLIFTLVVGIPRFIRESGYKKFAGSLYFDALFRPNRVSGLNGWHNIHRMAAALLVLYLFTLVIFTSFVSWRIPLIFGSLGLIPVIMLVGMSGYPGKLPEMLISFMAPKMLIVILVLGVVALRGPTFLWYRIWGSELFRVIFISVLFMLIFHKFHVNMVLARKWSHRNRRGSAAMVWMAFGLQLLAAGVLLVRLGPEESLVALNRELLLLPGDFNMTPSILLPWMMIVAGAVTSGAFLLFILNRKRGS
ncbi:MAG: hypothetical protein K8R52_08285 [Bacteroidales bacterium]|nr:hypothetical protein [Bacteroidales bacterium]